MNTQTHKHTHIWTIWLVESIGPEGQCFENYALVWKVKLREATRDKKQLDFGFLLKGGGRSNPNPKLSRNFSKNLFLAWVWTFLRQGGGEVKSKPYEELFQLKFGHFPRKGGAWPKSKPNEELLPAWYEAGKKVPQTCPKIQGQGGSAKIQSRAAFFSRGFPMSAGQGRADLQALGGFNRATPGRKGS